MATRERVDKINAADGMVFQSEKQLKEVGDKLPADKKQAVESALEELKTAHKSEDLAAIDKAMEALNAAWHAASEDLYKNQGQPNGGAQQPNPEASGNAQGNEKEVTDVDFEEVK